MKVKLQSIQELDGKKVIDQLAETLKETKQQRENLESKLNQLVSNNEKEDLNQINK